jgi:hypothetical protein
VLVSDHPAAADGAGVLLLRDGACGPGRAPRLTVRAAHPDGRRLERAVEEAAVDALLRDLLAAGWHVEEVRR